MDEPDLVLVIRRAFAASPERLFSAWTTPQHLLAWWGPEEVTAEDVEVDLRVGGAYRIGNRFADGRVLWISGEFELIEPPHRLAYTWRLSPSEAAPGRVCVEFRAHALGCEIVIQHERIANEAIRADHARGWEGCLDGLGVYLQGV